MDQRYRIAFRRRLIRSADWRWVRAHDLVTRGVRPHLCDDAATMRAFEFLRHSAIDQLSESECPISRALALYRQNDAVRWKLEALLLARWTSRRVAPRLNLDRPLVKWYSALFYDVRNWLPKGRCSSQIFGSSPLFGIPESDLATLWKLAACRYGVIGFERVLAVTTGEGRERFSADALDDAALFVELTRIPVTEAKQLLRIEQRQMTEDAGMKPAAYYHARKPRPSKLTPPPVPSE